MSTNVTMISVSPEMKSAKLLKWLAKSGDHVFGGDPIADVETDKATLEVEAPHAGTISELLVAAGTNDVAVGSPIAKLRIHVAEIGSSAASYAPAYLQNPAAEHAGEDAVGRKTSATPWPSLTSIKAARHPFRTSGCSASGPSPRSSTRRMRRSWRWAQESAVRSPWVTSFPSQR